MYVPKRNQYLIPTSFPTSYKFKTGTWVDQFESKSHSCYSCIWLTLVVQETGLLTWDHCSVPSAIHSRQWIGGEEAINKYCHNLAVKGGNQLAEMLGTYALDRDYFNMVRPAISSALRRLF